MSNISLKDQLAENDIVYDKNGNEYVVLDLMNSIPEVILVEEQNAWKQKVYMDVADIAGIMSSKTAKDLWSGYSWEDEPPAIPKSNGCECGASHTSFPNHHLKWCQLYKGV